MAESYVDLQGAEGRAIHFRPTRRRARDVFSRDATVQVRLDNHVFSVFDISSNGLGVVAQEGVQPPSIGHEAELELLVRNRTAQRLAARVARVQMQENKLHVGFHVPNGSIDLEQAQHLDRSGQLTASLSAATMNVPGPVAAAVLEFAYLLAHYQRVLAPHEESARRRGEQALIELSEQAYAAMAPRFYALERAASLAIVPFLGDRTVVAAIKAYAETIVTPLVLPAPMAHRAYHKPLGYPGDYQVMLHCYADEFEGETAYAKATHRTFVRHPLSAGIVTRKNYVVECLSEHYLAQVGDRGQRAAPYRVLSLGCGPAKEVADFTERVGSLPVPLELRLIDQEPRALEVAHVNTTRAFSSLEGVAQVICLNLSFNQIIASPQELTRLGQQSFLYCTGLFDYLPKRVATRLLAALYAAIEPGGELLVGNAAWPSEAFFGPEFVLDWKLLYRTRDEMKELLAALPPEAESEVVLEPGHAYFFIRTRKPAQ